MVGGDLYWRYVKLYKLFIIYVWVEDVIDNLVYNTMNIDMFIYSVNLLWIRMENLLSEFCSVDDGELLFRSTYNIWMPESEYDLFKVKDRIYGRRYVSKGFGCLFDEQSFRWLCIELKCLKSQQQKKKNKSKKKKKELKKKK